MIIVFGSMNMDLVFDVAHFPCPGETVLSPSYIMIPGGKGANQAVAAARLSSSHSVPVFFYGACGTDSFGDILVHELEISGVKTGGISRVSAPTGCASIYVNSSGENTILVASGANLNAKNHQVPDDMLAPDTYIILQLETPIFETLSLAKRAAEKGAKVVLNAAPGGPLEDNFFPFIHFLIINEIEGRMLLSSQIRTRFSDHDVVEKLQEKTGHTVIMTRGAQGILAKSPSFLKEIPSLSITPIDTTAAGDTFVGGLVAQLAFGKSCEEALLFATQASGLACLKKGAQTSIPFFEEVSNFTR